MDPLSQSISDLAYGMIGIIVASGCKEPVGDCKPTLAGLISGMLAHAQSMAWVNAHRQQILDGVDDGFRRPQIKPQAEV